MNIMSAFGQLLDFLFKAAKAYANTPEGTKELDDVIAALEGVDNASEAPQTAQSGVQKSYRGG